MAFSYYHRLFLFLLSWMAALLTFVTSFFPNFQFWRPYVSESTVVHIWFPAVDMVVPPSGELIMYVTGNLFLPHIITALVARPFPYQQTTYSVMPLLAYIPLLLAAYTPVASVELSWGLTWVHAISGWVKFSVCRFCQHLFNVLGQTFQCRLPM